MTNKKIITLSKKLVNDVKKKYPEVEFLNVVPSLEGQHIYWVNAILPGSEELDMEIGRYSSEISANILEEHGYLLLLMPQNPQNNHLITPNAIAS